MPHPIYGPPSHPLHVVRARLVIPTPQNGHRTSLTLHGESETRRASLWTYQETWGPDEQRMGLQVADALRHVALVALQDHPTTHAALMEQLGGEGWVDQPLPF